MPAADNHDHLTYLLQLCELELLEREKRAAERRLKAARFPTMKTLEGFDFTARPSVNKLLVAEIASFALATGWSAQEVVRIREYGQQILDGRRFRLRSSVGPGPGACRRWNAEVS